MVSNFTSVIARLINGGRRTVNSLDLIYVYPDMTMGLFLAYQFSNFSLQVFVYLHFVSENPMASTGPLHFVPFFSCFGNQIVYFVEFRIDPRTQEKAELPFVVRMIFVCWVLV